ncbi:MULTISPECIES: HAMP domain-containing sensor histidine kinase [Hungatella]|uniref:HAMP domain-containing sensor histidine kinase n=1 Tax=Hungatella TaxID=1649459 RepID=UPI0011DCB7E8|nr:HAMP domain-containing sensor histidine kinase [Hungatella hathewayi]
MEKVKQLSKNLSLRKSIVLYMIAFVVIAIFLCVITAAACNNRIETIKNSYPPSGDKYYLTDVNGRQLGEGAYITNQPIPLSQSDQQKIAVLGFLPVIATPVYSALCILMAAMLFYRNKLEEPLLALKMASQKISNNQLDFIIDYNSSDELGQLCRSFEMMRSTLASNFSEMWRQIEERKRLNSAFAHELRTPLTVLKGYNEILQSSSDRQTKATAAIMQNHIKRLERYTASMGNLQRLEDIHPEFETISADELLTAIHDSADMACRANGKTLIFQDRTASRELNVDKSCILQVCNNLIGNAVRYAASTITLSIDERKGGLLFEVTDDGKGFSAASLDSAANPYFTEEKNNAEHFGLGLYICKLLCESHGGYLRIGNHSAGAKVTAFFKS